MLQMVRTDPAMPAFWGENEPGMQSFTELEPAALAGATGIYLEARDSACIYVEKMNKLYNVHKQIPNRWIESWFNYQGIISATDWPNFFALRAHKASRISRCWPTTCWTPCSIRRLGAWNGANGIYRSATRSRGSIFRQR